MLLLIILELIFYNTKQFSVLCQMYDFQYQIHLFLVSHLFIDNKIISNFPTITNNVAVDILMSLLLFFKSIYRKNKIVLSVSTFHILQDIKNIYPKRGFSEVT